MVYSSFQPIRIQHLNWVILSEIDVEEGQAPLMKIKSTASCHSIFRSSSGHPDFFFCSQGLFEADFKNENTPA